MGTYKTNFRGKPEDYWETTYFDFFSAITVMVLIIGLFLGITVLIVNWSFHWGTESYTIALSAATVTFIVMFLIVNYFLSRGKRKRQKKIMNEALKKFRKEISRADASSKDNQDKMGSKIFMNETQMNLQSFKVIKQ